MSLFNILLTLLVATSVVNLASSLRVVHVTDIHVDLKYSVGAPTKCVLGDTGLGCCRDVDIPLDGSTPANQWGSVGCDSPLMLWNYTAQWMVNNLSPDVIVMSGDFVDHHDLAQTWDRNLGTIKTTTDILKSALGNKTTIVIPILGNHDTYIVDQLYPGLVAENWLSAVGYIWNDWLPDDTKFSQCGYYQKNLFNNTLKIIVVNSLYYDVVNLAVKNDVSLAPCDQIAFVTAAMQNASATGQNIWLLGHIPPGSSECSGEFTKFFRNISSVYPMYQFWGHTHSDEFRAYANNLTVGLVAPAMVPGHGSSISRFPTVRLLEFNNSVLQNYKQYHLNLTAQQQSSAFIGYELTYDANVLYNRANWSSQQFYELITSFNSTSDNFIKYAGVYNYPESACSGCFNEYHDDIWVVSAGYTNSVNTIGIVMLTLSMLASLLGIH